MSYVLTAILAFAAGYLCCWLFSSPSVSDVREP